MRTRSSREQTTGSNFFTKRNSKMDPLFQYHPKHANDTHIGRHDLVLKTAVHALRHIPGAADVIHRMNPMNTRPVTQIKPPPQNNDGKYQMIHN